MTDRKSDVANMTTMQIEQRLKERDVPAAERDRLNAELANRATETVRVDDLHLPRPRTTDSDATQLSPPGSWPPPASYPSEASNPGGGWPAKPAPSSDSGGGWPAQPAPASSSGSGWPAQPAAAPSYDSGWAAQAGSPTPGYDGGWPASSADSPWARQSASSGAAGWQAQPPPPTRQWSADQGWPAASQPPLPAPRGRGNTGIVVFGVLGALIIAGGLWALATLATGVSLFGTDADDDPLAGPPSASAPFAPVPSIPNVPQPHVSPGPTAGGSTEGPDLQGQVRWELYGVPYSAILTTVGSVGLADVTYTDPNTGVTRTVRQTVFYSDANGQQAYVGSSPRDPVTGEPSANYRPDIFVVGTDAQGAASIIEVCDTSGPCAPATMG